MSISGMRRRREQQQKDRLRESRENRASIPTPLSDIDKYNDRVRASIPTGGPGKVGTINVNPLLDDQGRPILGGMENLRDPSGLLRGQLQDKTQLDMQALNQMRKEAMRDPGQQSVWRQLMQDQLTKQAGVASAGAQGQTQSALNQLATTGGLRGGAAERLATAGAQAGLEAQQQVFGQGTQLDIQDELNRQAMLGQVNQANLAAGQFQRQGTQFNIQNALNEVTQQRLAQSNAYNEAMRAWAAQKTAEATPSGGGGKK